MFTDTFDKSYVDGDSLIMMAMMMTPITKNGAGTDDSGGVF